MACSSMAPPLLALLAGADRRVDPGRLARIADHGRELGLPVLVLGMVRPSAWTLPETDFAAPGAGDCSCLAEALRRNPVVLAVGAHLGGVDTEVLAWLLERSEEDGDGLLCVNNGEPEPCFAAYHANCRPVLERLASERCEDPGRLAETCRFSLVVPPVAVLRRLTSDDPTRGWRKKGPV